MKLLPALFLGLALLAHADVDRDDPKVLKKILKEAVIEERLGSRGGVVYKPGERIPFTGWMKKRHGNGRVVVLGYFKDGEQEGLWTEWHDNGQKAEEGTCKNGKLEGLATEWDKEGKMTKQTRYKDGVEVEE